MDKIKVIISGGGTGGHIFPALSIASELKKANPENEILFVGAKGRMEMEKVPAAGFEIRGLDITGLDRKLLSRKNFALPFKVIGSIREARKIIREFKPDIAIGVGGYASAPLLYAAQTLSIPTLIQEQNGFAGLTNKILGRKAKAVCVAYEGMERFFPADRIILSGNPIRDVMRPASGEKVDEAFSFYGLDRGRKQLLIVGGSLGCRTLNESMKQWILKGCPGGDNLEIIWQCGKYYKKSIDEFMEGRSLPYIHHTDFISRMDLAFAAATLVVSRSGASSVSEICACGKASIFVPSPNVTEDHQTHNAMALVRKDAALIVKDSDAAANLMDTAIGLLRDEERIHALEKNALSMALTDAGKVIVTEIYRILK
ncbi:MAG: undecaprenyldiphospho-muramoylpentapeptide beta-N-acetylglucosaminyltransferase [Bacteroidales bacterium]|nr:undecaprenyldiphospho-muramoylpentapeptide beta-N-acetylglucosaminyltransferase [Bacteroidales bacterium]